MLWKYAYTHTHMYVIYIHQVLTEDAWIDNITRTMLSKYPDSRLAQFGIVSFTVSYNLLGGLVLLNVVMAILVGELCVCVCIYIACLRIRSTNVYVHAVYVYIHTYIHTYI